MICNFPLKCSHYFVLNNEIITILRTTYLHLDVFKLSLLFNTFRWQSVISEIHDIRGFMILSEFISLPMSTL